MRITDLILQNGGPEAVRRNAGVNRSQETKPGATATARAKDAYVSSNTSASANAISSGEAQTSKAIAQASPDVRQDRIDQVKQRIQSGYYNSAEFTDKLADKLINQVNF